jgi:DNA (cytosine-5)-methyltransferase 1
MFRTVSLFSGCGGMDLGFVRAGFHIVRAIDNDPAAIAVHAANFGQGAEVGDVTAVDFDGWKRELGSVDVVLGGFPCQGFSKAGPKRADDPRNSLYRAMRDAVRALHPTYFVAENVEGLAQNFGGQYLELIQEDFREIGYDVAVNLIDAIGFGVPQHRRRIFFIGQNRAANVYPFHWPEAKYSVRVRNGESGRPRSMSSSVHGLMQDGLFSPNEPRRISEEIGDLRSLDLSIADHQMMNDWPDYYHYIIKAIGPGQKLCNVRHGPESVRTWDIPQAFGQVSSDERRILEVIARNRRHKQYGSIPNGNPLPIDVIEQLTGLRNTEPTLNDLCHRGFAKKKNGGFDLLGALFCSGLFKRPDWNAPSPTVLTNFGNPRYFLHPVEDRPFSLREAARLQGFPDDFGFLSSGISLPDGYRLVGNAVPPPLANALAASIAENLGSVDRVSA